MKTMAEWAREIHENAVAHGWWEEDRTMGELCALIHSELSEALEEARAERPMLYVYDEHNGECIENPHYFAGRKPEGIAVELADAVIRMLDWMAYCGQEDNLDLIEEDGERFAGEYARSEQEPEELPDFVSELHDLVTMIHVRLGDIGKVKGRGRKKKRLTEGMAAAGAMVYLINGWLRGHGVQLKEVMEIKHEYNKTRPYRHGKAF